MTKENQITKNIQLKSPARIRTSSLAPTSQTYKKSEPSEISEWGKLEGLPPQLRRSISSHYKLASNFPPPPPVKTRAVSQVLA